MAAHAPVKSSSIASVAYDPAAKVLEVRFNNGGHYRADGVEPDDHATFLAAESMGKHFNQTLRSQFTFTKVPQETQE